jgi:hypothetical protein
MSGDVERVAAVLAAHRFVTDFRGDPLRCSCGANVWTQALMDAHLAQVLLAPGGVVAGMVAEARFAGYSDGEAHGIEAVTAWVERLADEWDATAREQRPHLGCFDMYRHLASGLRAALAAPGEGS